MNENRSRCLEEPAIKRSFATLSAVLPNYGEIDTKPQNAQCGTQSCNKPRSFIWRRLLSYLPSWFKGATPDSPVSGIEAAESSKPNPSIRICHAKACAPVEAGYQHTQHEIMEKRSLKKPSYEQILSSFNFEDVTSDPKSCCERCKQMGLTVCGIHTTSTDSSNNKNSKPIQIGVAEVSSHKGNKTKNSCACAETSLQKGANTKNSCACAETSLQKGANTKNSCACAEVSSYKGTKTKNSCACDVDKTREVQKTPITITSTPNYCKQCMATHPSCNSSCRQSLLEQAWAYLQSLISAHRSGCQRCNQRRSNDMNSRTSCNSNTCKETLLEQAVSYLKKITSVHKNGCPRCQQKQSSCNSNETSYLQSMLEQAWLYIKKMNSDTNACCQRCKQSGRRVCCKHSVTEEQSSPRQSSCATKHQGILKYPSISSCRCRSQVSSIQEFPKKQSCPAQDPRPSCPKPCEKKTPQPVQPIPHLCRSSEERTFDKNSCYIPYCKQNSQHSQLALTGSHHKSCCLSQLALDPQKPACTGTNKKSCDSIDIPIDYNALCASFNKNSVQSIISREILEYHSSAKCGGPCDKSNSKSNSSNNQGIKQGISLTQEPNDHKFCTRPKECKHSKQSVRSVDQSNLICNDHCTGVCSQYRPPEEENKLKDPSCLGGCAKCNKTYSAAPMYQEQRAVDAEYEAFLINEQYGKNSGEQYAKNSDEQYGKNSDEQYGNMVNQSPDQETVCDNGCSCVTCIEQFNSPDKCTTDDVRPKADPHNYRFYY